MMQRFLLFVFLLTSIFSFSQGWRPIGVRSNSLGGSSVAIEDSWAYFHNPGATANLKEINVGLFYENRFIAKETSLNALSVCIPLKKGVLSIGSSLYGFTNYRQSRTGVGYAMPLSELFSLGIQANLNYLRLGGNYGSTINGTAEMGALAKINEKWSIAMSVMNIGRSKISSLEDRYTSVLRAGLRFKPSKVVMVTSEVEKQVMTDMSLKLGIEYQPVDVLFIRLGMQTELQRFSFGVGYQKNGFLLDLGTDFNTNLGWSTGIGLNYKWLKK